MRRRRSSSQGTPIMLAVAGVLVLVLVLIAFRNHQQVIAEIAQTDADVKAAAIGTPITDALPYLYGFERLATIPADGRFPSTVMTVYRKTIGRARANGVVWDVCVDQNGVVVAVYRNGPERRR